MPIEFRFYSWNGEPKLWMTRIYVEDANYWNMVDCEAIEDHGQVQHFDTLYDEYEELLWTEDWMVRLPDYCHPDEAR